MNKKKTTSVMDILRDIVTAIYDGSCDRQWAEDMLAKIEAVEEHIKQ